MKKLYLIRHGESEWNVLKRIQGNKDTNLTELGQSQASFLASRLVDENIDIIYSSDLTRAYETARAISDKINKPLIKDKLLREIQFGSWEGLTISEIKANFAQEYKTWLNEPGKFELKDGESLHDLKKRMKVFIIGVLNKNQDKNIAIVSHGATLKVLILELLAMDLLHFKNITLDNVSLSIIELRDFNKVLTVLNDTSHLKGLKI